MAITATKEAKFYKRRHEQNLIALKISQTYIDHMRLELFPLAVDKAKSLLDEIERELTDELSRQELNIMSCEQTIIAESQKPLNVAQG